ncbi:MAG: hypothetical protein H0U98_06660 [Alphaproteobacteria bacterium]|nr:hypothetical protein [Alphaproteobacteria bacterium]
MNSLNKICVTALLLGATAVVTPAMAQAAAAPSNSSQAQPSAPADAAPMDKAATSASTTNTAAAQAAEQPASATAQATVGQNDTANTQAAAGDRAMTHDTDVKAAANANVDAAGDTPKKYVRKNRAADFANEQSITQQLNQQASTAASPTVR